MDEQLYIDGMGLSLDEKAAKAIENMRHYQPDCGYEGGFSGGKDSCVIKHFAALAGVKVEWVYNQTTIDPPELIYFMRENHKDVRWRKAEKPFFAEVAHQGLPSRRARWCCRLYKERKPDSTHMIFGLRRKEGPFRSARVKLFQPWGKPYGRWALNPLAYWSDEELWQYIHGENIKVSELYAEGWHRLGCIGCPMGRKQRARQFERWPGYGKAWRLAAAKYWKTHQHTTAGNYKTADDWFEWWLSDEAVIKEDDCQMGLF